MTPRSRLIFFLGGIVALLLAGILIAFNLADGVGETKLSGLPQAGTTVGDPKAPLAIEEFSDFQCPFCGRFARETAPRIIEEYVKTGKVRFVYRHFAFIGQESLWAAEAAECASNQGRFWDYHDKLFASQAGENRGAFSKSNLKRFAQELGLDQSLFDQCLDRDETQDRVRRDTEEAQRRQVRSTPTFYMNGEMILGALPFETFKATLDRQLAR